MFSTPQPPPPATQFAGPSSQPQASSSRRSFAAAALRKAGLAGGDVKMAVDKPSRLPLGPDRRKRIYTAKGIAEKDKNPLAPHPLATRIRTGKVAALSIRGAAGGDSAMSDSDVVKRTPPREARLTAALPAVKGRNINLLKGLVTSRYDATRKFLNLESLRKDPFWKQNGIHCIDTKEASKDIGAVILKLASQLQPPVETMSLANNEFGNLRQLRTMCHYLPDLVNLSFENNKLFTLKEIQQLSPPGEKGPSKIRELIFTGNPLRENADLSKYHALVLKLFPALVMLDQTEVSKLRVELQSSANDPAASLPFPVPMLPGILPENVQAIASQFLTRFFDAFDKNRPSLVHAYFPDATFSHSTNTSVPPRARLQRLHDTLPNQKTMSWTLWMQSSRNLTRIKTDEKPTKCLVQSAVHIVQQLERIPQTAHDITNGAKFIVDAFPVDGVVSTELSPPSGTVLFVTVHGEFTEMPSKGLRSFDRTMTLIPALPGSSAAANGWPCVILSDELVVRAYSDAGNWAPGPLELQVVNQPKDASAINASGVAPTSSALSSQPNQHIPPANDVLASLPENQRTLVMQVQMQTGLTTQFAGQCLEANGWDYSAAIANFEALRATIPPEAFS